MLPVLKPPSGSRRLALVWLGLAALLGLTMLSSQLQLGAGNIVANLSIATAKAALIAWFFMHLDRVRGVIRLFALGVVVWIGIMIGLTLTDYLARNENPEAPPPAEAPHGTVG